MDRLLDPLRDDVPLPPSEVDIGRAVRAGRWRLRARWAGAAAAVVALLLPVSGLPVDGASTVGPANPLVSPVEPEDFDPMRRVIELTGEFERSPHGYTAMRRWQRITLQIGESGFALVTVYAPGRQAWEPEGFGRPEIVPAEPIGGRAAYWVHLRSESMLAWQWREGAWAYVAYQDVADADGGAAHRDTLRRVATAVRVGAGEPVTMPLTLPLPEPYQLIGTSTDIQPPESSFVRTGLSFAEQDPTDPDLQYANVSVHVENGSQMALTEAGANRTVNGHPAHVENGMVTVFDVIDGFAIQVEGTGEVDPLPIAEAVRLLPTPSDRSTWTGKPVI